jgi:hypothetical protein
MLTMEHVDGRIHKCSTRSRKLRLYHDVNFSCVSYTSLIGVALQHSGIELALDIEEVDYNGDGFYKDVMATGKSH